MKKYLLRMARYNTWANNNFIEPLVQADVAMIDKEIASSFTSLRKTVHHIYSAEFVWLQRLELEESPLWIQDSIQATFDETCRDWQSISKRLSGFVEKQFDDKAFEHVFQYYNLKKQHFKMQVGVALQHVFNHSSYHRGQLVTMMRQAGFEKIPNSDLTRFIQS